MIGAIRPNVAKIYDTAHQTKISLFIGLKAIDETRGKANDKAKDY